LLSPAIGLVDGNHNSGQRCGPIPRATDAKQIVNPIEHILSFE
jgi:hypothetical protein